MLRFFVKNKKLINLKDGSFALTGEAKKCHLRRFDEWMQTVVDERIERVVNLIELEIVCLFWLWPVKVKVPNVFFVFFPAEKDKHKNECSKQDRKLDRKRKRTKDLTLRIEPCPEDKKGMLLIETMRNRMQPVEPDVQGSQKWRKNVDHKTVRAEQHVVSGLLIVEERAGPPVTVVEVVEVVGVEHVRWFKGWVTSVKSSEPNRSSRPKVEEWHNKELEKETGREAWTGSEDIGWMACREREKVEMIDVGPADHMLFRRRVVGLFVSDLIKCRERIEAAEEAKTNLAGWKNADDDDDKKKKKNSI